MKISFFLKFYVNLQQTFQLCDTQKVQFNYCKFFVIFSLHLHHHHRDPQLTSRRLSLPLKKSYTAVWTRKKVVQTTDIILLSQKHLSLHTHSHFSNLNASLFATLVPYFNCCYNLVSACLLFRFYRRPFAPSQSVRHQSEHLYTVPVFFCFTYIKKRLMMFIRTSLSLYTTSLGNVVEFGVPFVCWFCDDDFWGCTSHTHISL